MQGHTVDHPSSFNIKLNRDLYSRLISTNFFKKFDLEIKHLFVTDLKKSFQRHENWQNFVTVLTIFGQTNRGEMKPENYLLI